MSAGPDVTHGVGTLDVVVEALRIGVYAAAAALIVLALWLMWGGRADEAMARRTTRRVRMKWWFGRVARWSETLTTPTRLTIALASLLLGYHLAAWTAPGHVLPFRIPLNLWFLLVGGVIVACGSSLWLDRRQAADRAEEARERGQHERGEGE